MIKYIVQYTARSGDSLPWDSTPYHNCFATIINNNVRRIYTFNRGHRDTHVSSNWYDEPCDYLESFMVEVVYAN